MAMKEITMKELKLELSSGLRMLKGFCFEGELCDGWRQLDDNTIQFRKVDGRVTRGIIPDEIECIGTTKIFNERKGYSKVYQNVVLKA